jgi:5-methylcytosine-specific restriction protein A
MTIGQVTADSVHQAMAEHDSLGRDAFLDRYGFRPAQVYELHHAGKVYDSKAIVGAAHGYATGAPLGSGEFSGGAATVARQLRALGYTVVSTRSPEWDWQEVVLACALVYADGWRELRTPDRRVHELSAVLRRMPIHPVDNRPENFRSPDAVSRKTSDLATAHPSYQGRRTRGGKADLRVIEQFIADPQHMLDVAAALRAGLDSGDFDLVTEARVTELKDAEAEEGGLLMRRHRTRERDPKLRDAKIAQALATGGGLACEVCGFDFAATYGERGAGYIESHHVVPLHVTGSRTVRLDDLALICSNCHRMIHRTARWLRPDELRAIVQDARSSARPLSR